LAKAKQAKADEAAAKKKAQAAAKKLAGAQNLSQQLNSKVKQKENQIKYYKRLMDKYVEDAKKSARYADMVKKFTAELVTLTAKRDDVAASLAEAAEARATALKRDRQMAALDGARKAQKKAEMDMAMLMTQMTKVKVDMEKFAKDPKQLAVAKTLYDAINGKLGAAQKMFEKARGYLDQLQGAKEKEDAIRAQNEEMARKQKEMDDGAAKKERLGLEIEELTAKIEGY